MLVLLVITLLFLVLASYFDLKTSEIPDEISIGLVFAVLILKAGYSLCDRDMWIFLNSIVGGCLYFVIGYLLYRLGQWGGGDVKLFAGVGCAISGFDTGILPPYFTYFVDMSLVIIPYALVSTLRLGILNRGVVLSEFKNKIKNKIFFIGVLFIPFILYLTTFRDLVFWNSMLILTFLLPTLSILFIYLKVIEQVVLRHRVLVGDLREGDIVIDPAVEAEGITRKEMIEGVSRDQIKKIKFLASTNKISDEVTIQEGIPFCPVFLFAFLLLIWKGNIITLLVPYLI